METLFQAVDKELDRMVRDVMEICAVPSIAAQNIGMRETADKIVGRMNSIGIKTRLIPIAGGNPVIYGELKGASDKTVLFYNHYDVQPPEPLDLWTTPPFEPAIRDGKLFARGVSDNKGPLYSRLHAIETILRAGEKLPVSVKFLVEGEEEIGSPSLESFVQANKELLKGDACIWENSYKDEVGNPVMRLGNKGMLYVELRVKAAANDYHSRYAPVIPNAAWRLNWALSSLKDCDESILIDGFYDQVRPIPPEEYPALAAFAGQEEEVLKRTKLKQLLNGVKGIDFINKLLNSPTCTICGISSGYTGKGQKTVLPCYAMAKVDFRLVVDQDPKTIVSLLRRHLDKHGFGDVEVHTISMAKASKTPITDPLVKVMQDSAKTVYGRPCVIEPTGAGTGPRYVFTDWTDMPIIAIGPGYAGSQNHAPDENIVVADYCQAVKHVIAFLYQYGRA